MDNDSKIQQFFAQVEGAGWQAGMNERGGGVCIELDKPGVAAEPREFCGKLDDALAQARQYVADYSASHAPQANA